MLFKLSNLNSNLALTLGYLNPALNNSAQKWELPAGPVILTMKNALSSILPDIIIIKGNLNNMGQ